MVLVLYHSHSVFRYRAECELQKAISQVHKCSAYYKLNLQEKKYFGIENLPVVPARIYALGNQMLQISTISHMHLASGLPPILVPAISKSRNICVCVCVLKARNLLQGNLPSDFSTSLQYFTSYTDEKFITPVPHHICKWYNFAAIEKTQVMFRSSITKSFFYFVFTSSEVNRTSLGKPESPFSFISGQNLYLAKFIAYILETEPPAEGDIQIY